MMEWDRLIAYLRAAGAPRAERFADLLEMDLEGSPKRGPEGKAWGDRHGDHVSSAVQSLFRPEVSALVGAAGAYTDDFLGRQLEPRVLRSGAAPSFEHAANAPNKLGTAKELWGSGVHAVRYVPLSLFLRFFLGVDPYRDLPPPTSAVDRAREARVKLEDGLRSLRHPGRPRRDLGNPMNGRVWVTTPESRAPHAVALARGDAEPDVCTHVVRRMGLTDYEEAEKRADKIGLVALGYLLGDDVPLYRPTILDAVVHPIFYPGPKGRKHGETLPLTQQLDRPDARATPGEPEWIHRNFQVLLMPAGTAPSTCWVLWYGTW